MAIELRILAYYLARTHGDFSMAEEFRQGKDPHYESARMIFGKDDIADEERQAGKVLGFSMVYGGGAPTILRQLGPDLVLSLFPTRQMEADRYNRQQEEKYRQRRKKWTPVSKEFLAASRLVAAYRNARPGIGLLQNSIRSVLDERGYIKTLWGRHLRVQEHHKALNALIQGTAAELIRDAMRKVSRWSAESPEYKSHMVNVVHDELILDCVEEEVPLLIKVIPTLMDNQPISDICPIEVDAEITHSNWAAKQSVEAYKEAA